MAEGVGTAVGHPARQALSRVDEALADLAAANLWSMSTAELLELRAELEATRARMEARVLAVTREVDGRGAAVEVGAPSTAAWLRGRLRMHPGAAKAEVELAKDLDGELAETGEALAAGHVSRDQAAAVALAMHRLPRGLDQGTRSAGEAFVLGQAAVFDPAALHILGRHLALTLDPERGQALEREEARQADRQELYLIHHSDGSWSPRGLLGPEGGALLDAALREVSAPRPAADGTPDPRSAAQRRAEGLLELVRLAAASPDLPAASGEPVTLLVTVGQETLRGLRQDDDPAAGAAAVFEDGSPMSPEAARRLGCDAWLVAAVIGSSQEVLDIGRRTRVVPSGMRRALHARDTGCAFPGCGRPARWCHAHHIRHWAHGGPTALDNLVLLCGHHHRVVHHDGWAVWIDRDTGKPFFRPPGWIDPEQRPRPAWRPPTLQTRPLRT